MRGTAPSPWHRTWPRWAWPRTPTRLAAVLRGAAGVPPPPPAFIAVSVLCLEMEYEASLPEKKSNTLSRDLIDYVRYMIQNHGENYKVSVGCPGARSTCSNSLLALPRGWSRQTSLLAARAAPGGPSAGATCPQSPPRRPAHGPRSGSGTSTLAGSGCRRL
uniref:Uncharacterized protein n=1 Tax=Anser brachyrhynchus TaxID=132585 RepID=A0A8B9I9H4_9AVES